MSRVVGGLLKGSVTLATTMMSDVTNKENRGKGMVYGINYFISLLNQDSSAKQNRRNRNLP